MENLKFVAATASGADNSARIGIQFTHCTAVARLQEKP
jgi:hypothetical protein